jgi:cysteine protease ATG4
MEKDENGNFVRKRSISSDSQKVRNLLQTSIDLERHPSREEKTSMWTKLKSKMSNFTNNLKYNTFTLSSAMDYYSYEVIRIYDKVYLTKEDFEKFSSDLFYIIYLSYRSNFPAIYSSKSKNKYMTDCGWGCMIRTAQMMLARGIQMIKFQESETQEFSQFSKKINYGCKNSKKLNLTIETIILLMDIYLPSGTIKLAYNELIENMSTISGDDSTVRSALPPFSIHNICKVGELFDKNAGEWFSDVNMINIFCKLNSEYKPIKDLNIVHFTEGVIYQKKIEEFLDFTRQIITPKLFIFVSVRHGISKLSSEYIQSVKDFFQLPCNMGLIGGRDYNAHYFIGQAGENLLYLDPHLNQSLINSVEDLIKDPNSYLQKQIYQTNVKNMSPAFTIGFCIQSFSEYENFISAIKVFSNADFPIFRFKTEEETKPNFSFKEIVDKDEDDF